MTAYLITHADGAPLAAGDEITSRSGERRRFVGYDHETGMIRVAPSKTTLSTEDRHAALHDPERWDAMEPDEFGLVVEPGPPID